MKWGKKQKNTKTSKVDEMMKFNQRIILNWDSGCPSSENNHAHHYILDTDNYSRCKYCGYEKQFHPGKATWVEQARRHRKTRVKN